MVIPVEIELPGGVKKLEIGYNQGENPFSVAQQFIDKHMLEQGYLREIADYITQRAGDYRAPVIGSSDALEGAPSSAAPPPSPSYKYFPVVRASHSSEDAWLWSANWRSHTGATPAAVSRRDTTRSRRRRSESS